jgi:hypothetical protein
MREPLGFWMLIGLEVRRLLIKRASMVKKLCVLPVSAIVVVIGNVGGSAVTLDARFIFGWSDANLSIGLLDDVADFPPCQLPWR